MVRRWAPPLSLGGCKRVVFINDHKGNLNLFLILLADTILLLLLPLLLLMINFADEGDKR